MTELAVVLRALDDAGQLVDVPPDLPAVTGVADDSRTVRPGALFCAIAGTVQDGHRYVPDAHRRGAAVALVTRRLDEALPQIVVRDGRTAAAVAAREWFGRPGEAMGIVAVTGTNGKSTTVALTRHLLGALGPTGSLGTLGAIDPAGRTLPEYQTLTTPGAVELQAALAALRARDARWVVMEASSHALHQRRLETLTLRAAVFTNLTQDHLDYHGSLEAYREAKLELLAYLGDGGVAVVNDDDPAWRELPARSGIRLVRYGSTPDALVAADRVDLDAGGCDVALRVGDHTMDLRLPLVGRFNVSNALGAAAAAWGLGVSASVIADRLRHAPQVPGRMERLVDHGFVILRDYAHTPDALERVLEALRPVTRGRLVVVFGAGGDRDRGKRPAMGRIAATRADVAIVTSDNPRTEDPDAIIDEIEVGMENVAHVRITDRRAAIFHAVGLLEDGDCLVLAGKGHETYQVVGAERVPFDERELVRAALRERSAA